MARKKLKQMKGQRKRFSATFVRTGTKPGWKGREEKTFLVKEVRLAKTDQIVADHLWFNWTEGIDKLNSASPLREGDILEFDARVDSYEKGYAGRRDPIDYIDDPVMYERLARPIETDYKLSRPTKFEAKR